jgi:exodeoxyribonuclease VII large subunit
VISAVGHEIDFTIADFVADLRAPTPSAAAEQAVPDKKEMLYYLRSVSGRMRLLAESRLDKPTALYSNTQHAFLRFHPEARFQSMQQRFDLLVSEFEHKTDFLTARRHQVALVSRDMAMTGRNLSLRISEKT